MTNALPIQKEKERLAEIMAKISKDASLNPEEYLKESEVPHGGE